MLLVLTGLGKNARVPKALQEPNGPPRVLWTLTLPPWLEQTLSSCIHAAGRDTLKWHTSRCSLLVSVLPGRCYDGGVHTVVAGGNRALAFFETAD